MDLQNRENFLNKLAAKMGKARAIIPEPMDVPVNTYPTERLTHLSAVDLANEFTNSAKTMMVDVNVCRESDAVQTLLALCEKYGGGDVVLNSDERLTALGIPAALEAKYTCHTWSPETAQDNISFSEKAKDYATLSKDEVVKGLKSIGLDVHNAKLDLDNLIDTAKSRLGV